MACSSSEESSVERPVCSCAEVCFDNLSRGLVCFIIPICNRNITCLVRNLFPGFIPAFLRRYPWLYNIESRFTQMQEERVKVPVELSRTTFQVCRHKGWTCFPINFLFKNENVVDVHHFVPLRIYLCLLFFAISIFIVDLRVRQNLDKNLTLVDPDPGKAYTRAKKAKCNFRTVDTDTRTLTRSSCICVNLLSIL